MGNFGIGVSVMALQSGLVVSGLELEVNLGWPAAERAQPQTVLLDMGLQFPQLPQACLNDNLDDTICYDTLIALLRAKIRTQHFRLLEHLGHAIYLIIQAAVLPEMIISIRVKKFPPIDKLNGGVVFFCGNENFSWSS